MQLIPTIGLQNSKCVSLNRGRLDEPTIWHVDPVERAHEFADTGAEWMQVTDFDAITGDGNNLPLIEEIIRHAGIPVQMAGGMRTSDQVATALDKGAGRVVIGSSAVQNPDLLKTAAKYHPDQIILAVDVFRGKVTVDGWRRQTMFEPEDFIRAFEGAPLAAILITDVDTDVGDTDGSLGLISHLAEIAKAPVIASGIIRGLDDISRLKYVRNISGALCGEPLFSRAFSLADALEVARLDIDEPVAELI